jgi:ribosome-binding protein aMBF1 (putative translation factor)
MPYEPGQKSFGEKIRISREALGLSQGKLAEGINIDINTLGRWEMDKRKPEKKYLKRLDDIFSI